ncbi:MAG: hypothetical protein ABIH85_00155 [Candidatus Omnitrophota bacterium]
MKTKMKKHIRSLLIVILIFANASMAFAQNYYAFTVHKSSHNNYLLTVTLCSDKKTCDNVLKMKSPDLDNNWKLYHAECQTGAESDDLYRCVFNDEPASEPYISFLDLNGHKTILKFGDIQPLLINFMIRKWAKGAKAQGAKNVMAVYPNGQKETY